MQRTYRKVCHAVPYFYAEEHMAIAQCGNASDIEVKPPPQTGRSVRDA
jgi:hypothetical protein